MTLGNREIAILFCEPGRRGRRPLQGNITFAGAAQGAALLPPSDEGGGKTEGFDGGREGRSANESLPYFFVKRAAEGVGLYRAV